VDQLGPNALGEVLEPGQVADCYLGLLLPPGPVGELEAGTVLIVARPCCCILEFPSPTEACSTSCSGPPEAGARSAVFIADLTGELRAWPNDTWAKLGVDPVPSQ
jgi:hypothetical protein